MDARLRKSLCFAFALVFYAVSVLQAQQNTPHAPVPPQVTDAKTAFLSNAGADSFFLHYSGGNDRAYNDLYAALKHWGKYGLVSSPADADLILEIRSAAPSSEVPGVDGAVSTSYDPQLLLRLLDPKTRTVLWTLTSYVHGGVGGQKTRDRQFDQAAGVLFDQLRQLKGETLTPEQVKATRARPGASRGTKIFFGVVLGVAVGLPIVLLIHFRSSQPKLPTAPTCTGPFCPVA